MSTVKVNLSGIDELDFPSGVSSATTSDGVTTINLSGGGTGIIGIGIDGGGSTPTAPIVRYIFVPYACTITGWSIIADQTGSASLDVWFIAGTGAPPTSPNIPTSANKISSSAPIALSSAQSASGGSAAIATWNTALTQWGTLAFNLSTATTVKTLNIEIQVTK